MLISSEALEYEVGRIVEEARRNEILSVLALATERLLITDEAEALAVTFEQRGLRGIDAIHLALASIAKADFFTTYDDKLFRQAQTIQNLSSKITTLLGLVPEVTT